MSLRSLVFFAVLLATVSGCGNERTAAPDLREASPSSQVKTFDYPAAGLTVDLPRNFRVQKAERPGVFRAHFGGSALAAYAYRRREELPGSERELREAVKRLEKAAKERSPSFRLARSRTLEVNGSRAIELEGSQTISQSRLRIRSLHIFKGKAEYVIELLAPPREFDALDARLSEVIERGLRISGRVTASSQPGS